VLSRYQRFSYRVFKKSVEETARKNVHLRLTLQRAHINLRPEVYLAYSYMNMAMAFVVTGVFVLMLILFNAFGLFTVPTTAFLVLVPLPAILAAIIYLTTFILPDLRSGSRARDIDAKLPYALNYISIMASAGITLDKIFASLAKQPVYGEIASEAAWLSRDLTLLGKDMIGAITAAIDRSPSIKFQDFLQGTVINITSGGDMKNYFRSKSEQFAYENRQDSKKFLDNLGVIAESFVTVVVAAPLFMLVLLSVLSMFGTGGKQSLRIGYMMILLVLPLAQLGFGFTIKSVTVEP
jgi:flagellar protein FlaJ